MGITVTLLGTPQVSKDGQVLTFPYRKTEGLFYYLCVRRSVSRDEAISILWADNAENSARKNLRDAIYHLKKLLGENVIQIEGNNRVSLRMEHFSSIDYNELTDETLFERYNGDFLGYFYIKNCIEFEQWATDVRDDLMRRYQTAIEQRVAHAILGSELEPLITCSSVLLRKRLLDEPLYRDIMGAFARNAGYHEAEQLYEKLKIILMDELGTEPEEETTRLMEQIAAMQANLSLQEQSKNDNEYFFGREKEMKTLLSNLYSFNREPANTSVLLSGEAGVGKTAILRRLKNVLQSNKFFIITCQCVQTEEDLYLKPWNDILAQVENYCKSFNIPFASTPDFYAPQIDASLFATQYELFAESMFQSLAQCTTDRKIVILIDDVQWMDNASKRLLSNLLFWSKNEKLSMILTSREDYAERLLPLKAPLIAKGLLSELSIPRFTLEETEQIISEKRPTLLESQGFLEKIYHSTDGNALFLLEYLKDLHDDVDAAHLSPKITGLIQSRLAELTADERDVLDIISLYPRFATIEELQFATAQPKISLLNRLEQLLSHHLICQASTYAKQGYGFSHQLIRDYIYNGLLVDKRQALHRLIAEQYEAQYADAADIALCPMLIYHFDRCNDINKTYTYRLEYLHAFYAVQHEIYPTVLTGQMPADTHVQPLGGEDELVSLAMQIRALNQKSPEVAPLRMKLEFLIGRYDLFSGAFKKGLENIHMSISLAKELDDAKYLMENYLQMVFHSIQIHNLKMLDEYISACEHLLSRYSYSEADICTVLRLRAVYYMKNFQYAKAENILFEIIERIEPLCRADTSYRIGLAACYNYLGEGKQAVDQSEEALTYYRKAIECCEGEGLVSGMGVFYSNAGYILYKQGKYDQSQSYIDKAKLCFAERGALWGRSKVHSYTALLAIERGDWDDAVKHFNIAKQIAQQGGNPSALSLVSEVETLLKKKQRL